MCAGGVCGCYHSCAAADMHYFCCHPVRAAASFLFRIKITTRFFQGHVCLFGSTGTHTSQNTFLFTTTARSGWGCSLPSVPKVNTTAVEIEGAPPLTDRPTKCFHHCSFLRSTAVQHTRSTHRPALGPPARGTNRFVLVLQPLFYRLSHFFIDVGDGGELTCNDGKYAKKS